MLGFLRNFLPRSILAEKDDFRVVRAALEKALELAMLDLREEALEIIAVIHAHPSYSESKHKLPLSPERFFLHAAGEIRMSQKELQQVQLEALQTDMTRADLWPEIDWANVTAKDYDRLHAWVKGLETSGLASAEGGFDAMKFSQALVGLCYVANALGRSKDVQALLERITRRIHAYQQSSYFALLSFAWPDYFLAGILREKLDIDRVLVQDYAKMVLDTVRSRLENGPVQPDMFYRDCTMQDLLDLLDKHTQEAPLDDDYEEEAGEDETIDEIPASIVLPGATRTEINATEKRLGRPLPEDLKDFHRLSNGTFGTSDVAAQGSRKRKLVPLRDMYIEEEDYMDSYVFSLLPGLDVSKLGIEDEEDFWGGISAPGIAMYDNHDQGTEYTWIFDRDLVDQSKQSVQELYDNSNMDQKARIDDAITKTYGTWETYDEMQYCIYCQVWGEPNSTIFASFRSYLSSLVYNSKVEEDPSPIKLRWAGQTMGYVGESA